MEVARAKDQGHDEEDTNTRIERQADGSPHQCLAEGACKRQDISDEVELGRLGRSREEAADVARDSMERDVEPASDGIIGRVLPGLEAIAMAQIVGRLPVVEGLVTVLDRSEGSGDKVRDQEDVKGGNGFYGICVLDGPGKCQLTANAAPVVLNPRLPRMFGRWVRELLLLRSFWRHLVVLGSSPLRVLELEAGGYGCRHR